MNGKRFDSGELVKHAFEHRQPAGFQSYVLNSRKPKFQDLRVREALDLALDFEWMNRQLFYGGYPSGCRDLFGNTDCEAEGLPSPEELALLEPWRAQAAAGGLRPDVRCRRRTDGAGQSCAPTCGRRRRCWRRPAGTYRDGALRNAKGEAFDARIPGQQGGAACATVSPWMRNLEKLGIELQVRARSTSRCTSSAWTSSSSTSRRSTFPGTHNPGQQLADLFGSKAADTEGSGNYMGVKSPAVDALVDRHRQRAQTKAELLPACRALDRVIMHSHYLIPQWTLTAHPHRL